MKRITVEIVKEAYAKTGLRPVRRTSEFMQSRTEGCPVDALLVDCGVSVRPGTRSEAARELGLPVGYVCGFVNAVDGNSHRDSFDPDYDQGYADGRAVAAAIWGEG